MSISSRGTAAIASLTHVIDVVLGESASPAPLLAIKTALRENGILNIGDLMGINKTDIEDLTYDVPNSENNDTKFLNKGETGLLVQFQAFVKYRRDHGDPIDNNWTSITNAQFDEYRTRPKETGPLARTTNITTTTTPPNASQRSPANDFKKGIRRDPNMFHALKNMKTWDNWKRSTIAQARSQGVEEILDANYKCSTGETDKQELFDEKQKYMYGVFEQKLLTNTKKVIYRSNVRSALNEANRNLRMDPLSGEIKTIAKSRQDNDADNREAKKTPTGYDYGEPTTPTDNDEREDPIGDHWNATNAEEFDSYRRSYAFFRDERGDPIGEHWNAITAEESDTYRTSHEFRDLNYNL